MESYTIDPQLSATERLAFGAAGACRLFGDHPEGASILAKTAEDAVKTAGPAALLNDGAQTAGKGLLLLSLGAGVPLGVAAHHVGRNLRRGSDEEESIRRSILYYENAARNLQDRVEVDPVDMSDEQETRESFGG